MKNSEGRALTVKAVGNAASGRTNDAKVTPFDGSSTTNHHPREGLSVRYSRDDAGGRDSLGDVPVIFVIRPERGCSDTGRRQHRRPVL